MVIGLGLAAIAATIFALRTHTSTEGPEANGSPNAAEYPAAIPKIDVHVHLAPTRAPQVFSLVQPHGIVMMLNASGGHPGRSLAQSVRGIETTGGRLLPYCVVDFRRSWEPDWAEYAQDLVRICRESGAVGIKISKALGLGYMGEDRDLLRVDDENLDPLFEAAGQHSMPILIHTGDPRAFFEPLNEENERYAELSAHPSWSFHGPRIDGGAWPSWRELLDGFERRVARHPNTSFLGAHFGNAPEDPDWIERMLETYPNFYVETGARIPEIGRHDPVRMRALFTRFADRILFGTDFQMGAGGYILGSSGERPDPPERIPYFFDAHWRYFETNERQFEHPTPIQGDWRIDGIGLTREVLEKIYYRNAMRLFGIELPGDRDAADENAADENTAPASETE